MNEDNSNVQNEGDTNTQNEEAYSGTDRLDNIERELQVAIENATTPGQTVLIQTLNDLIKRTNVFINAQKERHEKIMPTINDINNKTETFNKKIHRFLIHIIFWNLLAQFLFWAEIKIGSPEGNLKIFGVTLSGIENNELIFGFLIFINFLHFCLMWMFLKSDMLLSNDFLQYINVGNQENTQILRILKLFKKFTPHKPFFVRNKNIQLLSANFIISITNREIIFFVIEVSSFSLASALLTLRTSYLAISTIQDYYMLPFNLFMWIVFFILFTLLLPLFLFIWRRKKSINFN